MKRLSLVNRPSERGAAKKASRRPCAVALNSATHSPDLDPQEVEEEDESSSPVAQTPDLRREQAIDMVLREESELFGVPGFKQFSHLLLNQLASAQQLWAPKEDLEMYKLAVETVASLKPRNALEAMLTTQMAAIHMAAMTAMTKVSTPGQPSDAAELYVTRATRLMRTFLQQLEVLSKLRGESGQQKVTVEHVNVGAGGQAIVGAVNTEGGRG